MLFLDTWHSLRSRSKGREQRDNIPPAAELEGGVDENDLEQCTAPPDGGYGWVCVAACFTINSCTWGAVAVGNSSPLQAIRLIRSSCRHTASISRIT